MVTGGALAVVESGAWPVGDIGSARLPPVFCGAAACAGTGVVLPAPAVAASWGVALRRPVAATKARAFSGGATLYAAILPSAPSSGSMMVMRAPAARPWARAGDQLP